MKNTLCIIHRGYSYCSCTSKECQLMPAVLRMNIHNNMPSFRVCLGFLYWLGDSPRCSQISDNHSNASPVPVIRDPTSSNGQPECPPRVGFSPAFDASMFTLCLLSDTLGDSQWLKSMLLMLYVSFIIKFFPIQQNMGLDQYGNTGLLKHTLWKYTH